MRPLLLPILTVYLAGCSPPYEPFSAAKLSSGMAKESAEMLLEKDGYQLVRMLKGEYTVTVAEIAGGESLFLSFCQDKLALLGTVAAVNQQSMSKFLQAYTAKYGKPREVMRTRERAPIDGDPVEWFMREVIDVKHDVELTWDAPFGAVVARFDHAARNIDITLRDERVFAPCSPDNRR